MKRLIVLGCIVAAVAARAQTEQAGSGVVGVTAKIGTLGYGADLTLGLGPYLNLRGGFNMADLDLDMDIEDATVAGKIDWQTFPILADVHPFGGGFRISGGVVINHNKVLLTATPGETLDFQDTEYEVDSLDGSVTFDDTGYYAGFGYGNAVGRDGRWHFSCDFGILYHGEPRLDAHAHARNPAVQEALNRDLQADVDQWEADAKDFRYYPVISVGVSFAF